MFSQKGQTVQRFGQSLVLGKIIPMAYGERTFGMKWSSTAVRKKVVTRCGLAIAKMSVCFWLEYTGPFGAKRLFLSWKTV